MTTGAPGCYTAPMSLAGRPKSRIERMIAVATEHVERGKVYIQRVEHDEGCPSLHTQSLLDCTCDPTFRPPEEVPASPR